ncbi:uncharacterized protein BCR38DRAFT_8493 [Pseudomassariella vexata]|uniref:Uncharacterized protein n=1 Tax=Pseudomassariella vexata TaxID=1141098 RepID=A0A1Y2EIF5_9PEZI|nr:uncharacterized protein BCR38DRAFT_8493 [Pseudomassariella vexata]ORY71343.1 hypothetical protein BCR38DRAFT_8493 [Pseudomassariella vexata]
MRRCTALWDSTAIISQLRHSRAQWRPYTSDGPKDRRDASTPSAKAAAHQPDDVEWFKIDSEAKTLETAVGNLPLSPIMDPSYWEAKEQHKTKKPKPGKPQNSVERQFHANPFAQALATPLRNDPLTRHRLPRFFLQDFDLVAHPDTGNPWWVPRSLTSRTPPVSKEAEPNTADEDKILGGDEIAETEAKILAEDEGSETDAKSNQPDHERVDNPKKEVAFGPSAYVPARKDLLDSFAVPGSGYTQAYRRLMAATTSAYRPLSGKAVWREDMGAYVLDLMRQQIVDDLLYLSKLCAEQGRYYIVKCYGWDDVQYKHKGALLWFDEPSQGMIEVKNQPGPFATFDFKANGVKTSVAVHNMTMLLGNENANRVKNKAIVFKDGAIFMAAGRRTTDLQIRLWKLQGYLADYKDLE